MKKELKYPDINRGGKFTVNCTTNRFINDVLDCKQYSFLNHYSTVVDIGANIGTFSIYMYDRADKIYAIEPSEENVKLLEETRIENGFEKIIIKQLAISNHSHNMMMARHGSAGGGGWKMDPVGDYEVPAMTLLDFMDDADIDYIDLLKMDVEGHELDIIQAPLFPYKNVGTIIGELHKPKEHPDRIMFGKTLEWMGYEFTNLPNDHFIARK